MHALRQPQFFQQGFRLGHACLGRMACNPGWHHDIFNGAEFWEQPVELEDKTQVGIAKGTECIPRHAGGGHPPNAEVPGVGQIEGAKDLKKGGFSCTRGANNGDDLSRFHRQIHVPKDLQRAKAFGDVGGLNHA